MTKPARSTPQERPQRERVVTVDERLQRRAAVEDGGQPVRTVIYIEVGDTPGADVRKAIAQVSQLYAANKHPTFVCPVRHGKLSTDVIFEADVLEFVRNVCDVRDGEIVLRSPPLLVDVFRAHA